MSKGSLALIILEQAEALSPICYCLGGTSFEASCHERFFFPSLSLMWNDRLVPQNKTWPFLLYQFFPGQHSILSYYSIHCCATSACDTLFLSMNPLFPLWKLMSPEVWWFSMLSECRTYFSDIKMLYWLLGLAYCKHTDLHVVQFGPFWHYHYWSLTTVWRIEGCLKYS